MKIIYNPQKILYYFVLAPFLCPRGFSEFSTTYKRFVTIWLFFSILFIGLLFIYKLSLGKTKIKISFLGFTLYFGMMLIETLILQAGINEGLQKIFAAPALFIFLFLTLNNNASEVIIVISNIILVNTFLNCTFFLPQIMEIIANESLYHINFVGHVQVAAQIGILGVILAYILLRFGYKRRAKSLVFFSSITMLISGTIASYISIAVLLSAYIIKKSRNKKLLTNISPPKIFLIGVLIQIIIIPIVIVFRIDFGARYFIWEDALKQLSDNCISGFGAFGVLIHTFWSATGMNYAHNEILQILLDGGLLLLTCYLVMCLGLLKINWNLLDKSIRYWFNIVLILYMIIGIPDAVTEYNYYFIFLILFYFLPTIQMGFCKYKKYLI